MRKIDRHEEALIAARAVLTRMGLRCQVMPVTASPFDLLVDGTARVEVKSAMAMLSKYNAPRTVLRGWQANLHRHNVARNGEVDFFVFDIPPLLPLFSARIQLVIPSSDLADRASLFISPRSLMVKYGRYWNRWNDIKEFCERCRATEVAHDYDKVQEDFRARDAAVQVP